MMLHFGVLRRGYRAFVPDIVGLWSLGGPRTGVPDVRARASNQIVVSTAMMWGRARHNDQKR